MAGSATTIGVLAVTATLTVGFVAAGAAAASSARAAGAAAARRAGKKVSSPKAEAAPAALAGDFREAGVRVDGDRVRHALEQRQVRQVLPDLALLTGEPLRRIGKLYQGRVRINLDHVLDWCLGQQRVAIISGPKPQLATHPTTTAVEE